MEEKIEQLLAVLEKDKEHIEKSLSRLNDLRGFVIKRDERGLGGLLEQIKAEAEEYAVNESARQSLRQALSAELGYAGTEMTLSKLEKKVSGETARRLREAKDGLLSLIQKLRTEYTVTAVLLHQCAKFNSHLLKSILAACTDQVSYYSSDGSARAESGSALMNLRF